MKKNKKYKAKIKKEAKNKTKFWSIKICSLVCQVPLANIGGVFRPQLNI